MGRGGQVDSKNDGKPDEVPQDMLLVLRNKVRARGRCSFAFRTLCALRPPRGTRS